jgi:hypothetical protein
LFLLISLAATLLALVSSRAAVPPENLRTPSSRRCAAPIRSSHGFGPVVLVAISIRLLLAIDL